MRVAEARLSIFRPFFSSGQTGELLRKRRKSVLLKEFVGQQVGLLGGKEKKVSGRVERERLWPHLVRWA